MDWDALSVALYIGATDHTGFRNLSYLLILSLAGTDHSSCILYFAGDFIICVCEPLRPLWPRGSGRHLKTLRDGPNRSGDSGNVLLV